MRKMSILAAFVLGILFIGTPAPAQAQTCGRGTNFTVMSPGFSISIGQNNGFYNGAGIYLPPVNNGFNRRGCWRPNNGFNTYPYNNGGYYNNGYNTYPYNNNNGYYNNGYNTYPYYNNNGYYNNGYNTYPYYNNNGYYNNRRCR